MLILPAAGHNAIVPLTICGERDRAVWPPGDLAAVNAAWSLLNRSTSGSAGHPQYAGPSL